MTTVLLLHAVATITMFGIILVVQVVHYPLFHYVSRAHYTTYQTAHMYRITYIVLPVMTVELITALILLWWQPFGLPAWLLWAGLGLIAVIWVSTGLIQTPLHQKLTEGFDPDAHRRLVTTNWIRTIAWSLRTALVGWMLLPLLQPAGI